MSKDTTKYIGFYLMIILLFFLFTNTNSQTILNQYKFSINAFAAYISGSTLIDNIRSKDPVKRETETELIGGYSYGIELSYDPGLYNSGIRLTLGSEYFSFTDSGLEYYLDNGQDKAVVNMSEKVRFIPIELGLKWDLPVSGEFFKVFIGGGGGIYFGDRIRKISNINTKTLNTKQGFSLNIIAGLDYFINRNLSANLEFKFRDASFDVESKYELDQLNINNKVFPLDNPFTSRILVDGVRISFGFKYLF